MQINTIYKGTDKELAKTNDKYSSYDKVVDSVYNVTEGIKERSYNKTVKEVKLLEKINKLISSDLIKRAYENSSQKNKIDNILFKLKNPSICIGDGYNELLEIFNELKQVADNENQIEQSLIGAIQQDLGLELWNDFESKFNNNEFLGYMMNDMY
jgi:hypothetical protein